MFGRNKKRSEVVSTLRTGRRTLGVPFAVGMFAVLSSGCTATPQPDIPQDISGINSARVRVDNAGHDSVLVSGLSGAADPQGLAVQVQNLRTATSAATPIASDGSFSLEIQANPGQILALAHSADLANLVYVAGNAERSAVEIGTEEECFIVEEPNEEACLICVSDAGEEIIGCELDDFSDEAPLNPANVADCLFLSADFVELLPFEGVDDYRAEVVQVFNDCGEPLLLELASFETLHPERFELDPEPGGEMRLIEPTFFGEIFIGYFADQRVEPEPDEGEAIINVIVPGDPESEFPEEFVLGTLILHVIAP